MREDNEALPIGGGNVVIILFWSLMNTQQGGQIHLIYWMVGEIGWVA